VFFSYCRLFSAFLATLELKAFDVKALRAFRVLRPLKLVSGVPSKCLRFDVFRRQLADCAVTWRLIAKPTRENQPHAPRRNETFRWIVFAASTYVLICSFHCAHWLPHVACVKRVFAR
jgi:hypothetical protein